MSQIGAVNSDLGAHFVPVGVANSVGQAAMQRPKISGFQPCPNGGLEACPTEVNEPKKSTQNSA
jgi:hypothetical protein